MTLKQKEESLRGEYRSIWSLLKHGSLTSRDAALLNLSMNLSRRCTELERMLGVTIQRTPKKLPSGKRIKVYSYKAGRKAV